MRCLPLIAIVSVAASVAACSSTEPLIDRRNVDDAKYNRDLAACRQSSGPSILTYTNPVGDCMKGKGYHVLM